LQRTFLFPPAFLQLYLKNSYQWILWSAHTFDYLIGPKMEYILVTVLLAVGIVTATALFSRVLHIIPNPLRFQIFLAYVGLTLFVSAIYSAFALCIFTLLGRHDLAQHTTSRLWWYITAPVVGIKLEVENGEELKLWGGKSPRGSAIFLVNHQSELDVLLVSPVGIPFRFAHADCIELT
jgi:hypothetical protein